MEEREKMHILTGGIILIALGALIFLHNTGIWGFGRSWPVLLVVIAVATLIQRVKDLGGWILLTVGVAFLLTGTLNIELQILGKYVLPLLLIGLGVSFLLKRKRGEPNP